MRLILAHNEFLDDYILNCELSQICGIAGTNYKFWSGVISANYENSRVVFINKKSLPKKYKEKIPLCTNLNGFVLSNAFCAFTGLPSSHLTGSNDSNLYKKLDIMKISKFNFVNLKKFYNDFKIPYNSKIYIEKCKYFSPAPLERRIQLTDTLCLGYY